MERHADALKVMTRQLEEMAKYFNDSGKTCECCGMIRYKYWGQREVRKRIEGAAIRLSEIAALIERRKNDPVFLRGEEPPTTSTEVD